MKKWLFFFFVTSMMFFIANSSLSIADYHNNNKQPVSDNMTSKPGEFLHSWMEHNALLTTALILLDLDDTTLRVPDGQLLGQSVMFYHMCKEQMQKHPGMTVKEIAERIDPLLTEVYSYLPIALTDSTLPKTINQLKRKGAVVMGFTSRGEKLMQITGRQLEQTGITFSEQFDRQEKLPDSNDVLIYKGVIFAGQYRHKGEILSQLLASGTLRNPRVIMMIDDRKSHLDNAEEILSKNKQIHFMPVLCTFPQQHPSFYDDKKARTQLIHLLYKKRRVKKIKDLFHTDPFTREFIKTECTNPAHETRNICKILFADTSINKQK